MAAIHPIAYEKHIIGTSMISTQVCIFWHASAKFGIDHDHHSVSMPQPLKIINKTEYRVARVAQ